MATIDDALPSGAQPIATRYLRARQVAERLGVCTKTIFRWATDGLLTPIKISDRVVLFSEAEVMQLIESSRRPHVDVLAPVAAVMVPQMAHRGVVR